MASGQNGGLWRLVGLEDHTGADKHAGDHGPGYGGDDGDHGGEHGGDHGCDHVGDHGGDHGGDGDNADVMNHGSPCLWYLSTWHQLGWLGN